MALFTNQQAAAQQRYAGLEQQQGESLADYYKRLAATREGGILGTSGFAAMPSTVPTPTTTTPQTTTATSIGSGSSDGGTFVSQPSVSWAAGDDPFGTGLNYGGYSSYLDGGQGVSTDMQDLGWGLLSYGNALGPLSVLLPFGGAAKVIGGAIIDTQIDNIDESIKALTPSTDNGAYANPADYQENMVTVSDKDGNVRTVTESQAQALLDLAYNTNTEGGLPEHRFVSDYFGNSDEAKAVAQYGLGSDEQLAAIEAQFNAIKDTDPQRAAALAFIAAGIQSDAEAQAAEDAKWKDVNKQFADLQTQYDEQFSTVNTNFTDLLNSQTATQDQLSAAQSSWESALAQQNDLLNQQGLSYQEKLDVATAKLNDNLASATTEQEKQLAKLQYDLSSWQAMADAERAQMNESISSNNEAIASNTSFLSNPSWATTTGGVDYSSTTGSAFNPSDFSASYETQTATVSDVLNTPTSAVSYPSGQYSDFDFSVGGGLMTDSAAEQAAAEAALSQALATGADAAAYTAPTQVSVDEFEAAIAEDLANTSSSSTSTSSGGLSTSNGGLTKNSDGTYTVNSTSSSSSDSSSSSSSKIVCTAMNERYGFGSFRNAIWLKYSADHLKPEHEAGYHAIFLPLVDYGFKQGDGVTHRFVRKALEHIARHRTTDIRAEMKGRKRDVLGRSYRSVLEPLCYAVGKVKLMLDF